MALAALLEQDERAFRALADAAPMMLWTADASGVCNFFNARWLDFAGLRHDELVGRGWAGLLHEHDRTRHLRRYERAVLSRAPLGLESRLRRGDGAWRWVRLESAPRFVPEGGRLAGFIGAAYDVTPYRENEAALQRELMERAMQERALWLRLADVQEIERRRLAAELHDHAGEPLTALRLRLAALLRRPDLSADLRRDLERCVGDTVSTVDAFVGAMSEMRPPMLDDYGLAAALQWYAGQIEHRAELEVVVAAPHEPPRLPPQIETALFRIAQECLRNVVRHAQATHADVALSHEGGRRATLRIEDDGVGLPATAAGQPWRWGVLTMRERAFAIGARLDIASKPGEGTCVTVTLQD